MDLSKFSLIELETLLKEIPIEIARQEAQSHAEEDEAKRRKLSLWKSIEELAKKQGIDLDGI